MTTTDAPAAAPSWRSEPCPAWCVSRHHDSDHPEDRTHFSEEVEVPRQLAPRPSETASACVYLQQHTTHTAPQVQLEAVTDMAPLLTLSLDQAERLRDALTLLVREGRVADSVATADPR